MKNDIYTILFLSNDKILLSRHGKEHIFLKKFHDKALNSDSEAYFLIYSFQRLLLPALSIILHDCF